MSTVTVHDKTRWHLVVGVDWPRDFCSARPHYSVELQMEVDVESAVRAGMDPDRLASAGSPVHRVAPTRRDSVVRDTTDFRSRRRDSHRLPGRSDRHLRAKSGSCIRHSSHSQRHCSPGWESTCAMSVSERCSRCAGK
jgi:hypothetical protein